MQNLAALGSMPPYSRFDNIFSSIAHGNFDMAYVPIALAYAS